MQVPLSSGSADDREMSAVHESLGRWTAAHYITVGIALPCLGLLFWRAWGPMVYPAWQSGMEKDHAALLMQPNATWPFWPMFALAFAALLAFVTDAPRYCGSAWVRLGLVMGMVLGAHFTIVQWALLGFSPIGVVIVGFVICWARWVCPSDRPSTPWRIGRGPDLTILGSMALATLVLLVCLIAVGVSSNESLAGDPKPRAPIGASLIGWPTAVLVTFTMAHARARNRVARQGSGRAPRVPISVIGGLIAAYGAAWALAISRELAEYEKLPVQPPPEDCYVANAACRGHRLWVRSEWVVRDGQRPFLVNEQLRTLKLGEIVLRAVMPRLHGAIRSVYDLCGPGLAARIRSPWAADVAYAVLIPFAVATRAALSIARVESRTRRWHARAGSS